MSLSKGHMVRWVATRMLVVALVVPALVLAPVGSASAAGVAMVADPATVFHRLYVLGAQESEDEHESWRNDLRELRLDLERDGVNQAVGSTAQETTTPSKIVLIHLIEQMAALALPGEEITIVYIGHYGTKSVDLSGEDPTSSSDAGDDSLWLNDSPVPGPGEPNQAEITDDELAAVLAAIDPTITITVILDSCYGDDMMDGTDDFKNSTTRRMIAPSTTCPTEPLGASGALVETITESVADGAGEGEADANKDGIVTAEELQTDLATEQHGVGEGYDVSQPDGSQVKWEGSKCGNCLGSGASPAASISRPLVHAPLAPMSRIGVERGERVVVTGERFPRMASVLILLAGPSSVAPRVLMTGAVSGGGKINLTVRVPRRADPGPSILFVEAAGGFVGWQAFRVRR